MIKKSRNVIIGIHSKKGVGKSTFAEALAMNFDRSEVIPLARGVYEHAKNLGWDGKKNAKGRQILQLLGTEIGRNLIDKEIWIKKWKTDKDKLLRSWKAKPGLGAIICDDVRFLNEADHLTKEGAYLIKLTSDSRNEKISDYVDEEKVKEAWNKIKFLGIKYNDFLALVGGPQVEALLHESEQGLPDKYFHWIIKPETKEQAKEYVKEISNHVVGNL